MDMSLDEIIQKNRIGFKFTKKGFIAKNQIDRKPVRSASNRSSGVGTVIDARYKIIENNRAKIRDARDKLVQMTRASGDARLRLIKKKNFNGGSPNGGARNNRDSRVVSFRYDKQSMHSKSPKYSPKMPPLVPIPRGYVDYDNMEVEEEYDPATITLRRTVHNDITPLFSGYNQSDRITPSKPWGAPHTDPFDCYEIPTIRSSGYSESPIAHRQSRTASPDFIQPRKGILRQERRDFSPPPFSKRRLVSENSSHLSYEMRSRLEHAPDPHASMGIFANPLKPQQISKTGYRIVVSNLHSSVTQSDIKELFEDIGDLMEARLVRPGIAEVIFSNVADAEKAVDTYHNRQLDGQPMKCLLVNPRASNKPTGPAIQGSNNYNSSATRTSKKTPLEIDIDALHKVLFRRH